MISAKIMIVEDNITVASDIRDCLETFNYTVTSIIASGEESILAAQTEQPDIVLMDIRLRDKMDGVDAAEQIYSRFDIPVVFLSSFSDHNLLDKAKQVGSFGYLLKPFVERELYTTLEMALYKAKAEKEYRQMEAQLRLLQKMESIGTLASGIAHDFNNILYVIMGRISLAEANMQHTAQVSENLQEAQNACFRGKDLAKKLMTFSKGGSPVKEKRAIGKLIKDVVVSTLGKSSTQPEFFIPENIRQVEIDSSQIKQVIENISANAVDAMNNKGVFKVTCENIDITRENLLALSQGKYIKISFKDQGRGIIKKNLNKVFDPYFSTKDLGVYKGQGLGLAICHSIITRHNGLITVESDPKIYTIFSVYLPTFLVEKTELEKAKKKQISQEYIKKAAPAKGKILVMDDDEAVRTFLKIVLKRLGHDVETCIEGKEAVEMYAKAMESDKPFDIIMLDLTNQFGMGAQEAMKRLLEIDSDAKGIVTTGYFDDSVVTNFKAYGFSGFLTKPASNNELKKVINKILLKVQVK